MGCLNDQDFDHWFANIHLSGPCNRSCYFCIGQFMPGQDMNNNLGVDTLEGYDEFLAECRSRRVTEVNITGTNTDPLLMKNLLPILKRLRDDGFTSIGLRTNAVATSRLLAAIPMIDKFSISITSFDPEIYVKTMGGGTVPDLVEPLKLANEFGVAVKLNTVLTRYSSDDGWRDIGHTISEASALGIPKINFREPYGHTHIGNPLKALRLQQDGEVYGNPRYELYTDMGTKHLVSAVYWDVHTTEVSSVNLYADGRVTTDYPVTKGHSATLGEVKDQSHFSDHRDRPQWVGTKSEVQP